MKSKTEAIIIGSMVFLGEADKLVTFFSLEQGQAQGRYRGTRGSLSRFGAGLGLSRTAGSMSMNGSTRNFSG